MPYTKIATMLAAALFTVASYAEQSENAGEAAYRACAACHLPDGAGVPGAFPPLRNRLAAKLDDESARKYLVAVVNNGLSGPISVNGLNYAGFMQPFGASISAEQIAAALNYVSAELRDDKTTAIAAFTVEEVEKLQQEVSGQSAASLRPEAF